MGALTCIGETLWVLEFPIVWIVVRCLQRRLCCWFKVGPRGERQGEKA